MSEQVRADRREAFVGGTRVSAVAPESHDQ